MKIQKICFLAGEYPTLESPKSAVFYQNLVHEFARMGIECKVIHPRPINYEKGNVERERKVLIDGNHSVTIYRPNTLTFGAKQIGFWNTAYISACFYTYSAKSLLNDIGWKPDLFYGHFISPAGIMAAKLSKASGIPAVIAYGESRPWSINTIGLRKSQKILSSADGFIAVSTKNKKDLIDLKIAEEAKIKVFPNGINSQVFYKHNKDDARKKMGWDTDKFIVAFVGHFNERKGVLRLDKAVSDIPDVYAAYAGSGDLLPKAPNTIYAGDVAPELMPWFLSAADIFVLPTLNEGCCNAIIEALACGLPVISSDSEFNYDVLSGDNAILIDPQNINQIRDAIIKLKTDFELRNSLAGRSIEASRQLDIHERAHNILNFMESVCSE